MRATNFRRGTTADEPEVDWLVQIDRFRRRWRFVAVVILFCWLFAGPLAVAFAQEEPAQQASAQTQSQKSYVRWVYDAAGVFFYPQMGISIALVAIIATNILSCLRSRFVPDAFSQEFEALVKGRRYNDAFERAKKDESFLGRVLSAGLSRLTGGYDEAIEAMQEVGEEENMKFEHRLSYLAMIANVATMVGLLGTVWGMVASFMVIGQSDVSPKPSELARGVSQALVTTVIGLMQAIPAVVFFTVLKNLLAKRVVEVGILSERMMRRFKGVSATRRSSDSSSAGAKQGEGS